MFLPVVLVLLAAGCGSTSRTVTDGQGETVTVSELRDTHLPAGAHGPVLARAVARSLLDTLRLSNETKPVTRLPRSLAMRFAGSMPATHNLVEVHRTYRLPGAPHAVLDAIRRGRPAGMRQSGGGSAGHHAPGQPEIETSWYVTFEAKPAPGVRSETLTLATIAAPGGGTLLRAEAQVVWRSPRPPAERVPAGVSSIEVTRRSGDRRISLRRAIGAASSVKAIIAAIDRLPIVQPGILICPEEPAEPVEVHLSFRDHTGNVLAQAVQAAGSEVGNCRPMYFTIEGHEQKPLAEGANVIDTVNQILGVQLLPH